jgi:hypothetical protein
MRARKHSPLFRDPTPRYVGRDELDGALRELDRELVEVLAAYVYGVAPSRLARRMDTAVGYGVQFLVVHALTAIRDSPQAESLREELRADHGPRYSRALRAAAQRMEVDGAPRCRQCAAPLASGAPTGRPRQYCGNACRQTAYRRRRRMRERTYDAATESVYRRGLTPPLPEQKPVPLPPLKPPRHGYRLGRPRLRRVPGQAARQVGESEFPFPRGQVGRHIGLASTSRIPGTGRENRTSPHTGTRPKRHPFRQVQAREKRHTAPTRHRCGNHRYRVRWLSR